MQNKLLIVCGLISCPVLAQNQPQIVVYGSVDQYIGYIHSSSGVSVTGINDGAVMRSRVGFRGAEDLGGGYQATFTLEQGLFANTGSTADTSRLFDRQAWVGMNTPVGEFRLGRQNSLALLAGSQLDYTERTTYGSVVNNLGVPSRYDNDISYKSPRMAGFQVETHFALSETAGESLGKRGIYQLGLDYINGVYRAGYTGLWARPVATGTFQDKVIFHYLYGNYDYGLGKIYLAYARTNNVTSNANGQNTGSILNNISVPSNAFGGNDPNVQRTYNLYQISADYRLKPQWRIGALYGVIRDTSGGKAGTKGGNVGAYYDMSKRTTLYGFVNYMKNETNAGFRFGGSGAPTANLKGSDINGQSLIGLQTGILHRF